MQKTLTENLKALHMEAMKFEPVNNAHHEFGIDPELLQNCIQCSL